jgi:PAS domain S-box-containing protein
MDRPLRCLVVEDSENDALLVVRQLRMGGYEVTWERVETAEAMRAALGRKLWDVVISGYKMTHFSGLAALELLKASGKGVPFIIVSGTISEEEAVAALKAGAHDYITKGKLARLVSAVERELREAVEWRAHGRADLALGESEERFRLLFESTQDAIMTIEPPSWRFTFANPATVKMFGAKNEEEFISHGPWELSPDQQPDGRASIEKSKEMIETAVRNGSCIFEWTHRRISGEEFPADVLLTRMKQGEKVIVQATVRDITVRKRAEEMLRASEERFRIAAEMANDIIYEWDLKQSVEWSGKIDEMLGYEPGKFPRTLDGWAASVHPDDLEHTMAGIQAHLEGGAPYAVEYRVRRKDGIYRWWSARGAVARTPDGKPVRWIGSVTDITARKQAEERNREQASLLDNANEAIYVTALDCTILYWNRGSERTYGWTSAEALSRKTTELTSPDLAATEALTAVLLKEGRWLGERWQMTKSGGMVEVFSRLTLVRNEQGQRQSVFVIDTDITEKKQLEAQFLRSQRLESIGALASGIAHDLNNVLAPILMGAPLVREKVKDQTASHLLEIMESSAKRGAAIVRQVLTFARGVEGKRAPLQPRHLLWEQERLAAETFPKGIRVESDVAADLWPVLGDATQLHQALMNLCINARDAMPGGGVLTLEAANIVLSKEAAEKIPGAQPGSFACLRVTDTGTGIPPEIQAKLFEPFFTTKAVGKGTGLGLSTALGIVRSHGGFVRVASKVGQGSTFELYLPAVPAEQVAVKKDSATPWPRALGEGILVVDDEAAIREVVRQTLKEFGYRVITAAHGTEALRIFQERRQEIQVVLTDMMMPEMDGPTLVAALRGIDPAVRIIGITGASDKMGMGDLKTLALSAMLAKPFTINKLLAVIKEALPVTAGHETAIPDAGESRPAPPG